MARNVVTALESLEFRLVRSLVGALERVDRARNRRHEGRSVERPHPEIRALLRLAQLVAPRPDLSFTPSARRARARRDARVFAGPPVSVASVEELTLDTQPPLRARLYTPTRGDAPVPLIVYFHGGGFVIGDLDTHDVPCRLLCREAEAQVLSVDYRLAPEHPFPAAVNDAAAAYDWVLANTSRLRADPQRIALAGDSAGANLATVTTQLAKQHGTPLPALQLLFYPTVDRTVDRASLDLFAEGYFLTRADVEWYTQQYVPNRTDLVDPRVSPLVSADLSGQSRALIVTAGFDPLRDEGDAYAEALRAAGNEVRLVHLTDLVHGFINMGALSAYARRCLIEVAHETRRMLRE